MMTSTLYSCNRCSMHTSEGETSAPCFLIVTGIEVPRICINGNRGASDWRKVVRLGGQ